MILAIDPGPKESAYCVWDGVMITIRGIGIETNDVVASMLADSGWNPIVAVEHLQCFGMAVGKETFETAYWIGEFRCMCKLHGYKFVPVYRSEVKMHFCNSMRAKDPNIRQALIDRLGPPGTKKAPGVTYGISKHLWSALAVAVMVADQKPSG